MTDDVIELHGVQKRFGKVSAVAGVDLEVQVGEIVALLGPNGAGKTTMIDMMLGLTSPSSGTVRVCGGGARQAVRAGRVGAMLQTGGLLRDVTVRETLQMVGDFQDSLSRVDDVLRRTNLTDIAGRRVSKCSGGEQQRVKFALALLTDPELLFLDEPTSGMDVNARQEFWEQMTTEATEGRTIMFATHYLQEAERFAQRVVLMAHGRIVADGSMQEVRGRIGRNVSATLPNGERVQRQVSDSDALARELLASGATDLIIEEASLDEVFTNLTKDD